MTLTHYLLTVVGTTIGYETGGALLRKFTAGGHRGWVNLRVISDRHIDVIRVPAGKTVEVQLPDDQAVIWWGGTA